jgi:hypothetical protein
MYRVLKNSKDFDKFCNEMKYMYISKPDKYPAIIIRTQIDPHFSWQSEGFKFSRQYETEYIYPDDIQKELFNEDFDKLTK